MATLRLRSIFLLGCNEIYGAPLPASHHIISRPEITSEYRVSYNTLSSSSPCLISIHLKTWREFNQQITRNAWMNQMDVGQMVNNARFHIHWQIIFTIIKTLMPPHYKNVNVFWKRFLMTFPYFEKKKRLKFAYAITMLSVRLCIPPIKVWMRPRHSSSG
jgi:hypothetical protein